MNPVTRISVRHLACFEELVLPSGPSTLLLGRNGTGKSTFLDILFSLRALIELGQTPRAAFPNYQVSSGNPQIGLDVYHQRRQFRYLVELTREQKADSTVSFRSLGLEWSILRETLAELSDSPRELTAFEAGHFRSVDSSSGIDLVADRSPLATIKFIAESPVHTFKQWIGGIWLLRLEPQQMDARAETPADELDVSGSNFASWLMNFQDRKNDLAEIAKALRPVIQGLDRLEFVRDGRAWVLVARFRDNSVVDFDKLSDGQRCLVVLHSVVRLMREHITLLLLDEPDAHVTPTEIYPLVQLLQGAGDETPWQLMVASHHPHVIDLMAAGTPWELVQDDGKVFAQQFQVDRTKGISASRHLLLRGRS